MTRSPAPARPPMTLSGVLTALRPYLTIRDVPLWLAGAALVWLIADGIVETLINPPVVIVVLVVVGLPLLAVIAGRRLVRRRPYSRRFRVFVALVALFAIFALPVQLAFVSFSFLPAALALLAVEIAAKPPPAREEERSLDDEVAETPWALPPAARASAPGAAARDTSAPRSAGDAATALDRGTALAARPGPGDSARPPRRANDDGFAWPEDEPPPHRSLVARLFGRR